ncbi:MAG: restriction endonuclease subunit S [Candidatus Micrarchaeia archaeon]
MNLTNKHLPDGWTSIRFEDAFERLPKTKIKAGEGLEQGKYKFFTSSDEQKKFLDSYEFDGEHLILGTGGVASIHYCNEKFSTSTDCFVMKLKAKDILLKYIYYFFRSRFYLLEEGFRGAGLKHLSRHYLNEISIPYPESKETQKKIISILEKAESLKTSREEADKLTNELLKSVFCEVFGDPVRNEKGWEQSVLKEKSEIIQIGPFGTQLHVEDYTTGGIPLVNPMHIINKKIVPDFNFTVSPKKYDELSNYHMKVGDIIMGRRGEMARCALVTTKEDGWLCGTGSLFIRPKNDVNSLFLLFCLTHASMKKVLENNSQGVTMSNLNLSIINNLKIIVPPRKLQNKFAEISERLNSINEKQATSSDKIDQLIYTLMQKAFSGELFG